MSSVKDILERFGEDEAKATWKVQGQTVIYHKALERMAVKAGVVWGEVTWLRHEAREAVVVATGRIGEGPAQWSIGEANMDLNYKVSPKVGAYPYAMAEKRAKDRVILKLIGLHGEVYSEEEADEFKASAPAEPEDRRAIMDRAMRENRVIETDDGVVQPVDAFKRRIQEIGTVNGITNYMTAPETISMMAALSEAGREDVRGFARGRLIKLGWGKDKK